MSATKAVDFSMYPEYSEENDIVYSGSFITSLLIQAVVGLLAGLFCGFGKDYYSLFGFPLWPVIGAAIIIILVALFAISERVAISEKAISLLGVAVYDILGSVIGFFVLYTVCFWLARPCSLFFKGLFS
jgi:hypothetical protein